MKKVPFKKFGQTVLVPHVTFTDGKEDKPPKEKWHAVLWVERGEDWYGLEYYKNNHQTVLVVKREDFLRAREST
jgi:hypothetical protein